MFRVWLAVLFVIPTSAMPDERNGVFDNCQLVGDLAKQIMTDRQRGVDQSTAMTLVTTSPNLQALFKAIAEVAYSFPAYPTSDLRDQAAADFGNALRFACEEKRARSE
ncbi:hypothetical protein AB4144_13110 [Rhizobiaceae sp. 2RAB30]